MALTPKQEAFCQAYIETGNQSEAYRRAYDAENMKPVSVNRKAAELFGNVNITARLAELNGKVQATHNVTVASLIAELEEARQIAKAKKSALPMVHATMGKAKIAGLDQPQTNTDAPEDVAKRIRDFVAGIDALTNAK